MNVGSVTRPTTLDTTQPLPPSTAARDTSPIDTSPIDTGRDVAEPSPRGGSRASGAGVSHGAGSVAALAAPPRPFVDPQIHRAAEAFTQGGLAGLDAWMRQSPADARWLLSVPRSELVAGLQTDLRARPGYGGAMGSLQTYLHANSIDTHLAATTQPQLREAVRQTVVGRIDAMSRALETLPLDATVAALRGAPAGSPLAELRTALRMPGNEMDRERVEVWVRTARHELDALRDTVMGQAWMPNEFPGSLAHVQRVSGLQGATPGSIAGQAFYRGHDSAEARAHAHETAIDTTIVAAEGTEVALHASHVAAHGGIAALAADTALVASSAGVGVGLAGLAFGYMLHHQVEENRAERTEVARSLGL